VPIYFLLHEAASFRGQVVPALAACWRRRSFAPCCPLAEALAPAARAYAERYHTGGDEPLLAAVLRGLPFGLNSWRSLVGEVLLYAAVDVPEIQTAPETLACLAGTPPGTEVPRDRFSPVQQVHYGACDLDFGGRCYRPDAAGFNDRADVSRLADYLDGLRPERWTPDDLKALPGLEDDEERAEEVELAREWFPALRGMYRAVQEQERVVVCEVL
jgi:hypothetical protein